MDQTYSEMQMSASPEIKPAENFALGIIGALIGAVLGGTAIILLSRLGYIASISGFVLAFCTLKGYELLAKGMSTKAVILCAVLMLVTPFVADWIDWAIMVYDAWGDYGMTFLDCVKVLPELLAEDEELMGEYWKNLGLLYLFVLMGGFYTVKNAFR